MEAVAGMVADAMLSALFGRIFDSLASSDFLKFARQEQLLPQLKKWEKLIKEINALLDDAEEKQMASRSVELWLSDLRDIAYDAEDVIDEIATEALQREIVAVRDKPMGNSTVWKFIPTCFTSFNPRALKFCTKMASKIQHITTRFEDIVARKSLLNLVENARGTCEKVRDRMPTSSLVNEPHVYGREKDKEAILELLFDSDEVRSCELGVISIVGMAGVGKTTVAQIVYNDAKVENLFELRVWVCVSEEFDVIKVTRALLEAVTLETCNLKDLNLLQVRLKEKLFGKKFLIILDDVGSENYDQWDVLRRPLAAGAPGSKVLVTTRNEGVASIMATCGAYRLKELSDDACLSLLASHALGARNFDGRPSLKGIAEEIVKKCKGLPLAAKTMGGLLRTKIDHDEWESILKSRIWDLPVEKNDILPALRLSYHHLPSHLKRCFAYCAILPKDYDFEKEDLVLLWMAEGLLQQPKGKKQMADVGLEYFHILQSRSFFQQSNSNKTRFVMHDLICDLAQSVSKEICFSFEDAFEGDKLHASVEKIRHVAFTRHQYDIPKRFEVFYQMKSLRTFIALPIHTSTWEACCHLSKSIVQDLLPRLRCLRVLCLSGYLIDELPYSIGLLKHLRYLNLRQTTMKDLPESLGSLSNLEILILRGCKQLKRLPQRIENLINLLVLDLTDTDNLQEMPPGIGNLKKLHILSKFIVGKDSGCGIGELRTLLHLQGALKIQGLENVVDIQDAKDANLMEKSGLDGLDLQWSNELPADCQNGEGDMKVIGMLQPHKNLKKLRISFYGGSKFPTWLTGSLMLNIVHLDLYNCRESMSLPSLGTLPLLKKVSIEGMDGIKKVDFEFYGNDSTNHFPSLEILRFHKMLRWEYWSFPVRTDEDSRKEFPCLRELMIQDCPSLMGKLPEFLPSLTKLTISRCPKLAGSPMSLPSLCELNIEDCNKEVLISIADLTSLTTLRLKSMQELTCLPEGFLQILKSSKVLVVSNCTNLTSLFQIANGLQNIISLENLKIQSNFMSLANDEQVQCCNPKDKELKIFDNMKKLPVEPLGLMSLNDLQIVTCPKLVSFPETEFLSKLRHVKVKDCMALKTLPSWLLTLDSKTTENHLEDLEIEECPSLTCFPRGQLPMTLKRLRIRSCTNLQSLPDGIMENDDSRNISQLENLEITSCPSLMSFPEGRLPTSLKTVKIWDCPNLEPLSEQLLHKNTSLQYVSVWNYTTLTYLPECLHNFTQLTELIISNCRALKSFPETGLPVPSLRILEIYNCVNLKSLPDCMLNLISLEHLTICDCPGLISFPKGGLPPNLLSLEIWDCNNLREPMSQWNLHFLASLKDLSIASGPDAASFPDEKCLLPTSLVSIYIAKLQNLESLSMGLQNLTALEELEVAECPKLRYLPREGLPARLGRLCIKNCQHLKQQFLKEKGAYWPLIAKIPCVELEFTDL